MPHAVISSERPIHTFKDSNAYFSWEGSYFIYPLSSKCDNFFARAYQKDNKIILKLEKITYPLITDDIKLEILGLANKIAKSTSGKIVHHNLIPTNKHCDLIKKYLLPTNQLNEGINFGGNISLELGMGSGEFIALKAKEKPENQFIGFEISNDAIAKAVKRFYKENFNNIKIVNYDARHCIDAFEENSIDAIFVNFPEPWYKLRKIKHALLNINTISKIKRVLKKGGRFRLLTDNLAYATSTALACVEVGLKPSLRRAVEIAQEKIQTRYERRWTRKQRTIYCVDFTKTTKTNIGNIEELLFPVEIKQNFILKGGIIFKIIDIFENKLGEKIVEITFGESANPQHAYFSLTENNELTVLPQTVFVFDRDAQRAFSLAGGQA